MKNVTAKNEAKKRPRNVVEMLEWILYENFTNIKSVEKENLKYTKICDGLSQPDVLYSFLGIYALGVWVYNKEENQEYSAFQSKIRENLENKKQKLYSKAFLLAIQESDEIKVNDEALKKFINNISKEKGLQINVAKLNKNKALNNFIKCYFDVGNIIPIWPGGNELKGKSGVFDIPELFFAKYREWYYMLLALTGNFAYLDKFNQDFNYNFENYKSLNDFLDSISSPQKYTDYLTHVNEIIATRTKLINEKLLNMK